MVTTLAFAAASWAILMALAPLLQLRRMLQRRSSEDLSSATVVLLPGFLLWVLYGLASSDLALVVPNVLAVLVATLTAGCALVLRRGAPTAMKRRVLDERHRDRRPASSRRFFWHDGVGGNLEAVGDTCTALERHSQPSR